MQMIESILLSVAILCCVETAVIIYLIKENSRLRIGLEKAGEQRKAIRKEKQKTLEAANEKINDLEDKLATVTTDRDKYKRLAYQVDKARKNAMESRREERSGG